MEPDFDRAPPPKSPEDLAAEAQAQAEIMVAFACHERGDLAQARDICTQVLARLPAYFDALNLLGAIAIQTHRFAEAANLLGRAVAAFPLDAAANFNHAIALTQLQQYETALAVYATCIQIDPRNIDAYANRGAVLAALKRYDEALVSYDEAFRLNPDYPSLLGTRLYLKGLLCDWRNFDHEVAALAEGIAQERNVSSSIPVLALIDSLPLQRKAAETWTKTKCPPNPALGPLPFYPKHGKIRVGYFSMDFRDHPVSTLLAGLFEAHDRERFEVYGFSYGPETNDVMRTRLKRAFDKFMDVRLHSDADVAALARDMEIDIAVDLAGHTDGARSGIFALRAAPIQVSYIGFPATMGASYIDYIIGDATVIPEHVQPHYAEKVVYLPGFQANDAQRVTGARAFTRDELGLPPSGFVFCCFNNTYKITPDTFDSWMRILTRVPGSVLFLYTDTDAGVVNLKAAAVARGVASDRLAFGKRLSMPEYLARFRAADLFLDTNPFNAGTTASDALWAGLPVITRTGESFAGRMATSLLCSIGLPELATSNHADYENLAVALADDPMRLKSLKQKLAVNRLSAPLFNTTAFTAHLEEAFGRMINRRDGGLPPEQMFVSP